MNKVFVNAIKQIQKDHSLSDTQLARLLKIDKSTVSLIKNGKRNPGGKVQRAIALNFPDSNPFASVGITDSTLYPDSPESPPNSHRGAFRSLPISFIKWVKRVVKK